MYGDEILTGIFLVALIAILIIFVSTLLSSVNEFKAAATFCRDNGYATATKADGDFYCVGNGKPPERVIMWVLERNIINE